MTFVVPSTDLDEIRADPSAIAAVYAQYRDAFSAQFPFQMSEPALEAAFCAIVAYDSAPYGYEQPTYDLSTLLHEPTLACDAYVALAWQLMQQLGLPTNEQIAVGWNGGAVGNHTQLLISMDGTNLLLDPTIGLVVNDVTLGGLVDGVKYDQLVSFYQPGRTASIDGFNSTVIEAVRDGLYHASDSIYTIPDLCTYLDRSEKFAPLVETTTLFGAAGGWTDQDTYPRLMGDINGDGKADIVGFGSSSTYAALGDGSTFGSAIPVTTSFSRDDGWLSQDADPRELADINGDGMDDIVGFANDGVYAELARGGGAFGPLIKLISAFGTPSGWLSQNTNPRFAADIDGDGKADIVGFGSAGVYVSHDATDSPELVLSDFGNDQGWTSQDADPRFLADVNGDGKADIVGFASDGVYVALATGDDSFGTPFDALSFDFNAASGWLSQDTTPRFLADVNGDGIADIVGFGPDGLRVALGTGDGHFDPGVTDAAVFTAANGWTSQNAYPRFLADIDGDGKADAVGFGSNGVFVGSEDNTYPAVPLGLTAIS